ncbi:FAD-binding oxidoreductase [Isoptericola sediminis]|uniref:Oxidoreductase n=1 Tax=Isoptericola sediminis TaxID=2733572 RepID=A0A849K2C4_9MICO|nr:oxidoreductase [Isoptericola sediminis]
MTAWHTGQVVHTEPLTASARVLTLAVPGFSGAVAGQHVDLRLTAPDGYQAVRSYSLARVGADEVVEIAVDEVPDGEVSPYLVHEARPGDLMEVRGPLGGYFVWRPGDAGPVQLVAGGSGIVPLAAMARARATVTTHGAGLFRLLASVRTHADAFFPDELGQTEGLTTTWLYSRQAPAASSRPPGRLTRYDVETYAFAPDAGAHVYVCGPTGFVETAAALLVDAGHDVARIRTERFGGG